ncbi:MAG TPA: dienelactone hydrolase family protein, partial [Flavitalea sp.]|nr:dienelactone hydrolase family protein [Flavitalea sp.]
MKAITLFLLVMGTHAFPQSKSGFISIMRFDGSRAVIQEQKEKNLGRIMQINLWYPSEDDGIKMTFGDYVALAGLELDSSRANNWHETGITRYFAWPESAKADKKNFLDFLDKKTPMNAVKSARLSRKKYPLVMLVHGFAADYAYLAEHLAAHGFVVMHVPVKGTTKYELDYQDKGLESQVRDYEFGLKILKEEFPVITEEIAVTGFSFGGQSAMALAIRNREVRAVVSLDGGIGSAFGAQLLQSQGFYDPKKIKQPVLHLYNPRDTYTDLSWLKSIPGTNKFLVAMKNMDHGHFTSFGILNKVLPGIMGKDAPDPGRGYEGVILITKLFLENTLKEKITPGDDFIPATVKRYPWLKGVIEKH